MKSSVFKQKRSEQTLNLLSEENEFKQEKLKNKTGWGLKSFVFMVALIVFSSVLFISSPSHAKLDGAFLPNAKAEDVAKNYFTVYDYSNKDKVVFVKGDGVNVGDEYLSSDNKLYEIVSVDNKAKIGYAEFVCDENLPKFNVKRKELSKNQAVAESNKKWEFITLIMTSVT